MGKLPSVFSRLFADTRNLTPDTSDRISVVWNYYNPLLYEIVAC